MYSLSVYSTLRILTLYMLGTKKHTLITYTVGNRPTDCQSDRSHKKLYYNRMTNYEVIIILRYIYTL